MSGTNDQEQTPERAVYLTNDPIRMIQNDPNFIKDKLIVFEVNKRGINNKITQDDEYYVDDEPFAFYTYSDIRPEYLKCLGRLILTADKTYDGVDIRQYKLFPIS